MKALDQARRLPPGLLSSTFMQMHQDSSLGFQGSPHRWLPLAKATILVRRVFSLRIMRMLRWSRSATYSSRSTWGHVAALQPSIFCPFEAAGRYDTRYQWRPGDAPTCRVWVGAVLSWLIAGTGRTWRKAEVTDAHASVDSGRSSEYPL
jgi:hypothetical protein